MQAIETQDWCDRCARRIAEIDSDIAADEAALIARDVFAFERTRAMPPEDAADFVASGMGRDQAPRFERRSAAR